jgi:hypothetical protein
MPEDGGLLSIDSATGLDIALATAATAATAASIPTWAPSSSWPRRTRNVAVTGARPLAVTNCLNFGSRKILQFAEAVRGLPNGCAALGVPITGGNVSFYNQYQPGSNHRREHWAIPTAADAISPMTARTCSPPVTCNRAGAGIARRLTPPSGTVPNRARFPDSAPRCRSQRPTEPRDQAQQLSRAIFVVELQQEHDVCFHNDAQAMALIRTGLDGMHPVATNSGVADDHGRLVDGDLAPTRVQLVILDEQRGPSVRAGAIECAAQKCDLPFGEDDQVVS